MVFASTSMQKKTKNKFNIPLITTQ